MTVADIDALLYLPGHDRDDVARALRIPALSPGLAGIVRGLAAHRVTDATGNAGLTDAAAAPTRRRGQGSGRCVSSRSSARPTRWSRCGWPRRTVRPLPVGSAGAVRRPAPSTSATVSQPPPAATPCPVHRARPSYRVSVKREPDGVVSAFVHTTGCAPGRSWRCRPRAADSPSDTGDAPGAPAVRGHRRHAGAVDAARPGRGTGSAPRGVVAARCAQQRRARVRGRSPRPARPAAERSQPWICYSAPLPTDVIGRDYTHRGRLAARLPRRAARSRATRTPTSAARKRS